VAHLAAMKKISDSQALAFLAKQKAAQAAAVQPKTPMGVVPTVALHTGVFKKNTKAETHAAQVLAKRQPVTIKEVEEVLCLMEHWPSQDRPNVSPEHCLTTTVPGMCFGLSVPRMQNPRVSAATTEYPNVAKLVVKLARDHLPGFLFSSCQVNYNYTSKRHVDGNNLGPSYIIGLGDYQGGELAIEGKKPQGCRRKWLSFCGTDPHWTCPVTNTGTRITLIYFANNKYNTTPPEVVKELKRIGFTAARSDGKDSSKEFEQLRLLRGGGGDRKLVIVSGATPSSLNGEYKNTGEPHNSRACFRLNQHWVLKAGDGSWVLGKGNDPFEAEERVVARVADPLAAHPADARGGWTIKTMQVKRPDIRNKVADPAIAAEAKKRQKTAAEQFQAYVDSLERPLLRKRKGQVQLRAEAAGYNVSGAGYTLLETCTSEEPTRFTKVGMQVWVFAPDGGSTCHFFDFYKKDTLEDQEAMAAQIRAIPRKCAVLCLVGDTACKASRPLQPVLLQALTELAGTPVELLYREPMILLACKAAGKSATKMVRSSKLDKGFLTLKASVVFGPTIKIIGQAKCTLVEDFALTAKRVVPELRVALDHKAKGRRQAMLKKQKKERENLAAAKAALSSGMKSLVPMALLEKKNGKAQRVRKTQPTKKRQ